MHTINPNSHSHPQTWPFPTFPSGSLSILTPLGPWGEQQAKRMELLTEASCSRRLSTSRWAASARWGAEPESVVKRRAGLSLPPSPWIISGTAWVGRAPRVLLFGSLVWLWVPRGPWDPKRSLNIPYTLEHQRRCCLDRTGKFLHTSGLLLSAKVCPQLPRHLVWSKSSMGIC